MNISSSKIEQINELAFEAIGAAQDSIVLKFRYLDSAVYALKPVSKDNSFGISTDGCSFFFEPKAIVRKCRNGISKLTHDYLHVLVHCIFLHNMVDKDTDAELWNIAADMAAEEVIYSMSKNVFPEWHSERQLKELQRFRTMVGELTAERIYDYLLSNIPRKLTREQLYMLFHVDEHIDWYKDDSLSFFGSEEYSSGSIQQSDDGGTPIDENEHDDEGVNWSKIAESIKMAAEQGATEKEDSYLSKALRSVEENIPSYGEFLKRFATTKEVVSVDDSSFDYIFYTYGMELYGDMPLIEPLETKDDKKIEDLVIVIDSSASTSGELVESFIQKTFEIFKDEDAFDKRFNIRLIQCDNHIQEDVLLRNKSEAENYLMNMKVKGQGGTDFRVAFRYIAELEQSGAFNKLKGIVYFTDGKGTYPDHRAKCDTAFVFANKYAAQEAEIPFWAIKTVLGDDDEY